MACDTKLLRNCIAPFRANIFRYLELKYFSNIFVEYLNSDNKSSQCNPCKFKHFDAVFWQEYIVELLSDESVRKSMKDFYTKPKPELHSER